MSETTVSLAEVFKDAPGEASEAFQDGVRVLELGLTGSAVAIARVQVQNSGVGPVALVWELGGGLRLHMSTELDLAHDGDVLMVLEPTGGMGIASTGRFPMLFEVALGSVVEFSGLQPGEYMISSANDAEEGIAMQSAIVLPAETTDVIIPSSSSPVSLIGELAGLGQSAEEFGAYIYGATQNASFHLETELDAEGRFFATLPNAGEYTIYLYQAGPIQRSKSMPERVWSVVVPGGVPKFHWTQSVSGGTIRIAGTPRQAGWKVRLLFGESSWNSVNGGHRILSQTASVAVLNDLGLAIFRQVTPGRYLIDVRDSLRMAPNPIGVVQLSADGSETVYLTKGASGTAGFELYLDGESLDPESINREARLLNDGNNLALSDRTTFHARSASFSGIQTLWNVVAPDVSNDMDGFLLSLSRDCTVDLYVRCLRGGEVFVGRASLQASDAPSQRAKRIMLMPSGSVRVRMSSPGAVPFRFHVAVLDSGGSSLPLVDGAELLKYEHFLVGIPVGQYSLRCSGPFGSMTQSVTVSPSEEHFVSLIAH